MIIRGILFLFCMASLVSLQAASFKVENIAQFEERVKTVKAGDSIVLANGVWKDAHFKFRGKGAKDQYIYLVAETPGKVFIEGQSRLQLSGDYLHVSGLVFRNGFTPKSAVIEFRTSSTEYAYNCILSECVIDRFSNHKDSADHWVGLWGKNNRVEYCYFGGKANEGVTLVVWPNDSNSINNNHLIAHNYFGPRPRLGSNGGETIRIGTSHVCHLNSGTIVANNYFERCNGEVEVISNKSGGNKFLNNTFFECEGSMVLRHGDNGVVAGNWFIGNGKAFTGGVRIINEGHQVYNNFFYKLRGEDFRAPLVIMNAIPNSPANGYAPVRNVIVANNTFVECKTPWAFGVGAGSRDRTVTPESTMILNNIVYSPDETHLMKIYDKTDGIKFDNNLMVSKAGMLEGEGFVAGSLEKGLINGVEVILTNVKGRRLGFVRHDIQGITRSESFIGAFMPASGALVQLEMPGRTNTGPAWFTPAHLQDEIREAKVHRVAPGTDILTRLITKTNAGDIIELEEGVHIITRKIVLPKSLTIRTVTGAKNRAVVKMEVQRENASMFEIEGNPTVKFENLIITGDSKARFPVKYAIVTSKMFATGYNLIIDGCEIADFNVATGAIFNAYKGTIADSIIIRNSVLRDAFRGFILSQEKEDKGKYSAEYVRFDNTVFSNITQYVIDYYRGGIDESTIGGVLEVEHCVFDQTVKEDKHYILKTSGIVHVSVKNSIFMRSLSKQPIRLIGNKHQILNCNFFECADPKVEKGAKSIGLIYENPRFEKKSYHLSATSKLRGKGVDGRSIGLR